jgi:hypothetical protein
MRRKRATTSCEVQPGAGTPATQEVLAGGSGRLTAAPHAERSRQVIDSQEPLNSCVTF